MVQLILQSVNVDLEIVESVPAEVAKSGATTVPAHMLYDIVRKLPDGAQLELDELPGTASGMEAAYNAYGAAQRAKGRRAFTDGPHYELAR